MLPDLERLIRLQNLHNSAEDARSRITAIPSKLELLETRLADRRSAVVAARGRLDSNHETRRTVEKDLAAVQSRLSKFKDQLMAVKTNREYQAMQKEIAVAEHEVQAFEDRILKSMLEADMLIGDLTRDQESLTGEQRAVEAERRAFEEERSRLEAELTRTQDARELLVGDITAAALALFEHVAKQRNGVAVVEARNGHCTSCHVRLRPQIFNDVRLNNALIQCDSCNRILHFNAWPDTGASKEV